MIKRKVLCHLSVCNKDIFFNMVPSKNVSLEDNATDLSTQI